MGYDKNSLIHFGIFGMRWGIRRFQNEDGTLTEEGKKRYTQRRDYLEGAKYHVQKNIKREKNSEKEAQARAQQLRKQPIDKSIVELWGDKRSALISEGHDMNRIKNQINREADYWERMSELAKNRLKDQRKIFDSLSNVKLSIIKSDGAYKKQIDDLIADGTKGLLRYTIMQYMYRDIDEYKNNKSHMPESTKLTLSQRFSNAQKDNPKLTYNQIYKEMGVDMNSDDPDDYKEAEANWFKKHGY